MVTEHALLSVTPGQEDAFEAAFTETRRWLALAMPAGLQSATLARDVGGSGSYLLVVEWRALADPADGVWRSDRYEQWRAELQPFLDGEAVVRRFEHVSALRTAG